MDQKVLYMGMLEDMFEGIYFVDRARTITFWNKGAELISGFTAEEMVGRHCYDNLLNHVDENGKKLCLVGCPLHATIQDGVKREATVFLHHKEGYRKRISVRTIPIYEDGKISGSIEVFKDKSKAPIDISGDEHSVDELKVIANYDQLTLIPNRRNLESKLMLKHAEFLDIGKQYAVIFIDIDNFRDFNNNFGHEIGDKVLINVGKTFDSFSGDDCIIGRWGGEEFLGILSGVSKEEAAKLAEQIRMLIEESRLRGEEVEHKVTISVGVAHIRESDDLNSIVKRADENMYVSKKAGKNRVTCDE